MQNFKNSHLQLQDFLLKYLVLPFIPRVVKPNHLTALRFLLTPVVIWLMLKEKYSLGILVFLLAAFTDGIDGSLARVRNQITKWGETYDPIADKILIDSVFLIVVLKYFFYTTLIMVVIDLSFILGGWWYQLKEIKIKVNIWGKAKMNFQVISFLILLVAVTLNISELFYVSLIFLYLVIIFALFSFINKGV